MDHRPIKVLIADDDDAAEIAAMLALGRWLPGQGGVRWLKAVEEARSFEPELMLLDIEMTAIRPQRNFVRSSPPNGAWSSLP